MTPCVVLRVCKLGKNISARFAHRYYDQVAPGLNLYAHDWYAKGAMAQAFGFDYALPLGQFVQEDNWQHAKPIMTFDEAIERVSEVMTIRQGDLIFIDLDVAARNLVPEEEIIVNSANQELLYCKIK